MNSFELKGEYIELIRLLKFMNWVQSGGEAKLVVEENMVKVNGEVELRKRYKVRKGDVIEFEGKSLTVG